MAKTEQGGERDANMGMRVRAPEAANLGFRGLGVGSASPHRLAGGTWEAVGGPGWDYLVGVEGKNSLILPGTQIYSKLGEERHSASGRACLARGPHTHQSRQHLEECLFHHPEERCG